MNLIQVEAKRHPINQESPSTLPAFDSLFPSQSSPAESIRHFIKRKKIIHEKIITELVNAKPYQIVWPQRASRNGFMMEENGDLVKCKEIEAEAVTQAERTAESWSRRRRITALRSFERMEIRRRHSFRTGDLSEESVAAMEERKGGIVSVERALAMASSSIAAAECVSRSESLWRHEELGMRWRRRWDLRRHLTADGGDLWCEVSDFFFCLSYPFKAWIWTGEGTVKRKFV
nr:hypothetical protein Iba_chr03bCG9190 [Ipomoea batatas]